MAVHAVFVPSKNSHIPDQVCSITGIFSEAHRFKTDYQPLASVGYLTFHDFDYPESLHGAFQAIHIRQHFRHCGVERFRDLLILSNLLIQFPG